MKNQKKTPHKKVAAKAETTGRPRWTQKEKKKESFHRPRWTQKEDWKWALKEEYAPPTPKIDKVPFVLEQMKREDRERAIRKTYWSISEATYYLSDMKPPGGKATIPELGKLLMKRSDRNSKTLEPMDLALLMKEILAAVEKGELHPRKIYLKTRLATLNLAHGGIPEGTKPRDYIPELRFDPKEAVIWAWTYSEHSLIGTRGAVIAAHLSRREGAIRNPGDLSVVKEKQEVDDAKIHAAFQEITAAHPKWSKHRRHKSVGTKLGFSYKKVERRLSKAAEE